MKLIQNLNENSSSERSLKCLLSQTFWKSKFISYFWQVLKNKTANTYCFFFAFGFEWVNNFLKSITEKNDLDIKILKLIVSKA